MNRTSYLFLLILPLVSCKDQGSEPRSDPYEQWRSYGLHAYTVDQVRTCFCGDGGVKMRVTVSADTVARVVRLYDNTQLSNAEARHYLTIDSLFGLIRYSHTDSLVVTYDAHYGYPERLDINPQLHPVDGGVLYETSNLQSQ